MRLQTAYGLRPIDVILESGKLKPIAMLSSAEEYNAWWDANINHAHGVVMKDLIGQSILFDDYNLTGTGKKKAAFVSILKTEPTTRKDIN